MRKLFPILAVLLLFPSLGQPQTPQRFFFEGHQKLVVKGGIKKLQGLSKRLVALLGYLQEEMKGGEITILSGYRSPLYNDKLRKEGRLAGKASLHMEGMAVDFEMAGVDPKKIWERVRSLDCCGVGYYHGKAIHLDTGPPRFWDETTSKVFTDISLHNKQIYVVTDYDIYNPNEKISFKIVRMTDYPFGIKKELNNKEECMMIHNREEAQNFSLTLPLKKEPKGDKWRLKVTFCQKPAPEMPDTVLSNRFTIASP